MKIKSIIRVFLLMIFILCIYSTSSNAMYQSKPGTTDVTNYWNWHVNVRRLEAPNYGMGLTEKTIDTNTLVSSTVNNIDAHMMKNSEYGAMVLLGASDYGKQGVGSAKYMQNGTGDQVTTTGNYTGVYGVGKVWEMTSGGYIVNDSYSRFALNYNNKYMQYNTVSERNGDATGTTAGWHGSGTSDWSFNWTRCFFIRGGNGAFSYSQTSYETAYATRAVVVNGQNF